MIHIGAETTAIDQASLEYVVIDANTFVATKRYRTFEAWYRGAIRAEFAERYGLVGVDEEPAS